MWSTVYMAFKGSHQVDGLVQDCSNSSALAMELLQSCTKPLKCVTYAVIYIVG